MGECLLYDTGSRQEFEDTKGVIRIRKLKKHRQHNNQKKKYKRWNNDLQSMHNKLKIYLDLFSLNYVDNIRIFQRQVLIYASVTHIRILQRQFDDGSCFHSAHNLTKQLFLIQNWYFIFIE
jgi:hypothetical protein